MNQIQKKLFIYPTDTVWGIGAYIYEQAAQIEIARIKKTSADKPLSIMFNNLNDLKKSFQFPVQMNDEWLETFFQLESTLGLPLTTALIPIPAWVHGGSDMISIRLSQDPLLQNIPSPFFSTSLNLTGDPPVQTYEEAVDFQKKYAQDAVLLGDNSYQLSGQSSTIVFVRDEKFEIIRPGRMIFVVRSHLLNSGLTEKN